MKLKSKDLILHLLNANGSAPHEPILGITRFQKIVFLFEKEIWKDFKFDKLISEDQLPQFEAYNFGPFSERLAQDIEFLSNLGFITTKRMEPSHLTNEDSKALKLLIRGSSELDSDQLTTQFNLSEKGKKFVSLGKAGIFSENQNKALADFKLKCNTISLGSLLFYVYTKYPEMTVNSHIKQAVLGLNA